MIFPEVLFVCWGDYLFKVGTFEVNTHQMFDVVTFWIIDPSPEVKESDAGMKEPNDVMLEVCVGKIQLHPTKKDVNLMKIA